MQHASLDGVRPWEWTVQPDVEHVHNAAALFRLGTAHPLSDSMLQALLTMPWVGETPASIQARATEHVHVALVEFTRVFCLQRAVETRREMVAQQLALLDMLAAEAEASMAKASHVRQSTASAPVHQQAVHPVGLRLARRELLERQQGLEAYVDASTQASHAAVGTAEAAKQFAYTAHSLMCLLGQVEGGTWLPERDDSRLQSATQCLTPDQLQPILTCLRSPTTVGGPVHTWLDPSTRAFIQRGYKAFLLDVVEGAMRQAAPAVATHLGFATQHIRAAHDAMLASCRRLLSSLRDFQAELMHGLPPGVELRQPASRLPVPGLWEEPGDEIAILQAGPLGSGTHLQLPATSAAATASSLLSALPRDVAAMVRRATQRLTPRLPLAAQEALPSCAARLGLQHGLLAAGTAPPVGYPPTAMDVLPLAPSGGGLQPDLHVARNGSPTRGPAAKGTLHLILGQDEGPRSGDEAAAGSRSPIAAAPAYPPPSACPSSPQVREWLQEVLAMVGSLCGEAGASGVLQKHGQAAQCVAYALSLALRGSAQLATGWQRQQVPHDQQHIPVIPLTPASWRGILLGAALAWVHVAPSQAAHPAHLHASLPPPALPALVGHGLDVPWPTLVEEHALMHCMQRSRFMPAAHPLLLRQWVLDLAAVGAGQDTAAALPVVSRFTLEECMTQLDEEGSPQLRPAAKRRAQDTPSPPALASPMACGLPGMA